jgi:glycerate dehydrogenase
MNIIKPFALFLDKASLYPDDLDFSLLEEMADWQWFDKVDPADLPHRLIDAEILVSNKVVIDKAVIANCNRLKLICVAATGYNNVDLAAAKQSGVQVCNVSAYATSSVVQHVFSLILALNRKLVSYKRSASNGDWSHSDYFCYFGEPISELQGKTLGIIGYGELGQNVARVARCFGMSILLARRDASDEREGRVDLNDLLTRADIVSLHCPLTEGNRHMIGENAFSRMKDNAILINTARGGLVDEVALLQALKNKQIAAAALDVIEQEPPSADNALLNYQEDNLIITPHIAWASRESRQRLVDEIAENIRSFQSGYLRNII